MVNQRNQATIRSNTNQFTVLNQTNETGSSSSGIEFNSHPLYLHNNDQPGMVLISKKLIGTENYAPWKRSIQIALSAKNKLVIADGSFEAPEADSLLFPQWQRVNDMVISWILNTVSDEISSNMNYVHSANAVWTELHERFSSVNGHKIYEVQRDLFKIEQGASSVELYFHKLKGLWEELASLEPTVSCTCGALKELELQQEHRKLIQFLMGLNDSFTNARGHILMMTPWPNINQAYSLIKQDEKQRQGYIPAVSDNMALASVVTFPSGKKGYTEIECTYCHGKNHLREKCFKLNGYPHDHPLHPANKGKRKQQPQQGKFNSNYKGKSTQGSSQVFQAASFDSVQNPDQIAINSPVHLPVSPGPSHGYSSSPGYYHNGNSQISTGSHSAFNNLPPQIPNGPTQMDYI